MCNTLLNFLHFSQFIKHEFSNFNVIVSYFIKLESNLKNSILNAFLYKFICQI